MIRQSVEVIKGYFIWQMMKWKNHLDDRTVVLVLTGENEKVDRYALKYLDYVIERKSAEKALIITPKEENTQKVFQYNYKYEIKAKAISSRNIELIYRWHCQGRFYKNLIFTYVRTNKDNLLERFLNETEINEEDVVCLALYNLRKIPEKKAGM